MTKIILIILFITGSLICYSSIEFHFFSLLNNNNNILDGDLNKNLKSTIKNINPYNSPTTLYNINKSYKCKISAAPIYIIKSQNTIEKHNFLKLYPLQLLINRYTFSYEHLFANGNSIEFQPKYILPSSPVHRFTNNLNPNIAFLNEGFEMLIGINRIKHNEEKSHSKSKGFYVSYKYQHIGNEKYWSGGMSGKSYHKSYLLSQTKNMMGIFYKLSKFNMHKKFSIDTYFMFGCYIGNARTVVFSINNKSLNDISKTGIENPSGLYIPNGIYVIPNIKIGISPRFKLN